ncbi:uncharacterized protein [Dendrobates tinctorius]|uniref:uncharacterized protein isoform X2 n=1 Tax=Dendrobates tinctorius TaxID=92724 RepID=UPI003CCA5B52
MRNGECSLSRWIITWFAAASGAANAIPETERNVTGVSERKVWSAYSCRNPESWRCCKEAGTTETLQGTLMYPEKFVHFCRLTIPAFDHLLDLLSPELNYQKTVMRRPISAEERLLITLRFLATGESYTSLHLQFRVGKSTISQIVRCTCAVIWQKLQPIVMPSPTKDTWLQVAAGFQSVANFPYCIGAVDGKHVRVQKPPRSGSRFFNYKWY